MSHSFGLVADVFVPELVLVELAGRRLAEDVEELAGDRTGLALAHSTVVDLDERHELSSRPREERLVGEVEIGAVQRALDHLITLIARDRHDRITRQPGERTVDERWRDHLLAVDAEDVLPRPL